MPRKEPSKFLGPEFRSDVIEILHDFLLCALVIGLLALGHKYTHSLDLPKAVLEVIDLLDACSKIGVLALLSCSLLLRFSKRLRVE